MEVKIPREVRQYKETIFFGLSMRQFFCSMIAVGVAIIAYFGLREYLGNEGVSWVCIFGALPIALTGFVTYHEMTLEHFVYAYIKSEWLMPKQLHCQSENALYSAYKEHAVEKKRQQDMQRRVSKNTKRKDKLKHLPASIKKAIKKITKWRIKISCQTRSEK